MDILDLISPSRIDSYDEWIMIGSALWYTNQSQKWNIPEEKALEAWKKYSRQSKKYQEGDCECMWARFKKEFFRAYTYTTLLRFARRDSPEILKNIIFEC